MNKSTLHDAFVLRMLVAIIFVGILQTSLGAQQPSQPTRAEAQAWMDQWLDHRWQPDKYPTERLVDQLQTADLDIQQVEQLLRAGRASYPKQEIPFSKVRLVDMVCDHVDYETKYYLYVPESIKGKESVPLLIVGHGGNGAMSQDYAKMASRSGFRPWLKTAEEMGVIVAAPLTERGWGAIGNSILLSLVSKLQREFPISPDRIYVTGHSMGGHLSWRSGISLADRWGAVSPMSGGYDYVDNQQVYNLFNVPGYATWGSTEPYQINEFNRKIRDWMKPRNYDWVMVEKRGGHTIYEDQIPKACQFLLDRPRNLYRDQVYAQAGGPLVWNQPGHNERWSKRHQWTEGRSIPYSTFHWIRLAARSSEEGRKQRQRLFAEIQDNTIEITSDQVRQMTVFLHPKMVDFNQPVTIRVNGQVLFQKQVQPDMATMLELVREFDDRGRIFHAAVELQIESDQQVPVPSRQTDTASETQGRS